MMMLDLLHYDCAPAQWPRKCRCRCCRRSLSSTIWVVHRNEPQADVTALDQSRPSARTYPSLFHLPAVHKEPARAAPGCPESDLRCDGRCFGCKVCGSAGLRGAIEEHRRNRSSKRPTGGARQSKSWHYCDAPVLCSHYSPTRRAILRSNALPLRNKIPCVSPSGPPHSSRRAAPSKPRRIPKHRDPPDPPSTKSHHPRLALRALRLSPVCHPNSTCPTKVPAVWRSLIQARLFCLGRAVQGH